jgi:hypothetical protein
MSGLFLPWYSCYGRSDWALTDRRKMLHEIIHGFVRGEEGASAKKPWFLQDDATGEESGPSIKQTNWPNPTLWVVRVVPVSIHVFGAGRSVRWLAHRPSIVGPNIYIFHLKWSTPTISTKWKTERFKGFCKNNKKHRQTKTRYLIEVPSRDHIYTISENRDHINVYWFQKWWQKLSRATGTQLPTARGAAADKLW